MARGSWRGALLVGLPCLASACGGEEGPTGPAQVATVTVTPSPVSVRVGETVLLSATAKDDAGNNLTGRGVTWTSLDVTIAWVTGGIVFGVGEGSTEVSAVVEGTPGTVTVTVLPPRIAAVQVRPAIGQVFMGATIQMTATPLSSTGVPLVGRTSTWTSSDTTIARVDPTTGLVTGVAGGEVVITATAEQQIGTSSLVVIDPSAPRITALAPYPLVEGASATATGLNFGATPADNAVTVDGVAATVTAASATSLSFTVPTTGCRPHRLVAVRVTADGKIGTYQHPLRPGAFTQVGIGAQVILPPSSAPCIQLDATSSFESYLVGVQSASPSATSVAGVRVAARTGVTTGAGASASPEPASASPTGLHGPAAAAEFDPVQRQVLETHALRHAEARRAEAEWLRSSAPDFGAAAAGSLQSPVPPNAVVGERFTVKVPPHYPGSCSQFVSIQAELRLVTDRAQWLVDVASFSTGTWSDAQLQTLADGFEDDVAPVLEGMFGPIPDTDANPRIAFVATGRVNQEGWLSYPSLYDYLPDEQCPASNEGDFLYMAIPQTGTGFTPAFLLSVMGYSLSHDFTHVIQNRAVIVGGVRAPGWIEEGQAGLGEEIFAHRQLGRSPRQNYGESVMFANVGQVQPYHMVGDLAYFYGFQDVDLPKVAGAPELCTWLDAMDAQSAATGPCLPPGPASGAWAFVRWLTDHYGVAVGGDGVLNTGLIDTTGPGFDRVEALVGVPIETLLARFAAALYVDDRVLVADPTLGFPSWNLLEYEQAVFPSAQLTPRAKSFAAFDELASVRGGSTLYYRIGASGRPATALEVTGAVGSLSPDVQVWVVRVQ